jgi:cholesterol oxidase
MSRPIEDLGSHYDVVVVGSGYGGSIAACRLAGPKRTVCLLERGRELHPGEYPNTGTSALRHMQANTPMGHFGSRTGMFDFHLEHDISVLVGCGLGGTSLINANVALCTKEWVFDDDRWPSELRTTGLTTLEPYYAEAKRMLGSTAYPSHYPRLAKLEALGRSAQALGSEVTLPPLNVTFEDGTNAAGIYQNKCRLCGDCVSGCNYNAKNTVLMNYLPQAHRNGASIFTGAAVRSVKPRKDGGWLVAFDVVGEGRERYNAPTQFVSADAVVLAAGALGSTEILLRSQAAGLDLSPMLGRRFTGNGDVLAVAYDADSPVHGIGLGRRVPTKGREVGPCIVGTIDLTDPDPDNGLLIEDGSPPGAMAAVLASGLAAAAGAFGKGKPGSGSLARRLREVVSILEGAYRGPVDRTLTFLVMSTDDDRGYMELDGDRMRVRWPGAGGQRVIAHDNEALRTAAEALCATFVPDPLWTKPFGRSLVTVHPLGGCVMGDDGEMGVVDHRGRVFQGSSGTPYPGLHVLDGSIVPRPLAVNPLLTISALAERAVDLMVAVGSGARP